jgi:hypothetical protein
MNSKTQACSSYSYPHEIPMDKILEAKKELAKFISEGCIEPNRGNLDDPIHKWKSTKPNYILSNLSYFKGKSRSHAEGSLEKVVENLVKTWEMEGTHKRFEDWTTINHEKYCTRANGGKVYRGKVSSEVGNYNWLMSGCKKDLYDSDAHTFDSSHKLFRTAFPNGFPWEVIDVFSAPPLVSFSWRHWADFSGSYKGRNGDNSRVNMFGFALVKLDENGKIYDIKIFYKPDEFLEALERI